MFPGHILPPPTGRLICIEGIDGSGKSSLISALLTRMTDKQHASLAPIMLKFPSYSTPLGTELLAALRGSLHVSAQTLQSMMVVNRLECAPRINDLLARGHTVIVDRYWPSGVAYGVADGLPLQWLLDINKGLPMPSLYVLLDIDPSVSFERRPVRADKYEADRSRLERASVAYRQLWEANSDRRWLKIDGHAATNIQVEAVLQALR